MSDDDDRDDLDDDDDDDDLDEDDDRYEDRLEDRHLDGDHLGRPNPDCDACVRDEELLDVGSDLDMERGELRAPLRAVQRKMGLERKPSLLGKLRDAAEPSLPRPPSLRRR